MTHKLRWGILGTGGIAEAFAKDLNATGLTISSVGSRSRESAVAFAAGHNIPKAHSSYEELVQDEQVDAVYIATPHPFHAANALLALGAGKHVLVEKPFTLNAVEAMQVREMAQRMGLVALEAMWTRWLPHMVRIREIIAAGTLGEIRTLIADFCLKLPSDPAHRLNNPLLGGGALLDLGIYPISFAWDLFGKPERILAHSIPTETGVDRATTVTLGYASGCTAVTHCDIHTLGSNAALIMGTEGQIRIDPIWCFASGFTLYGADQQVLERFEYPLTTRGMEFQALELERLLQSGQLSSSILPIDETVSIMETLDEVRRQIGVKYPGE